MVETAYWITQSLLAVAVFCAVYRVFRGPSVLDRVISVDVILIVVASMFLTDMVINDSQDYIVFVVGTAVIGFLGAVAIARFVAVRRPDSWQPGQDPRTDPGLGGAAVAHEPQTPSTGEITTLRSALLEARVTASDVEQREAGGRSGAQAQQSGSQPGAGAAADGASAGDAARTEGSEHNTSWFQALARSRMAQKAEQAEGAEDMDADAGEERS